MASNLVFIGGGGLKPKNHRPIKVKSPPGHSECILDAASCRVKTIPYAWKQLTPC